MFRRLILTHYVLHQAPERSIQLRQFIDYLENDGAEWNLAARRDIQRPWLCEWIISNISLSVCYLQHTRMQTKPFYFWSRLNKLIKVNQTSNLKLYVFQNIYWRPGLI